MKYVRLALGCLGACTSVGPMPTTTAISAVPSDRPSAEAQAAVTPVFRLSNAASGDDQNGQSTPQVSALFDADRLLARGLIVGARLFGESGDAGLEPYLGYR